VPSTWHLYKRELNLRRNRAAPSGFIDLNRHLKGYRRKMVALFFCDVERLSTPVLSFRAGTRRWERLRLEHGTQGDPATDPRFGSHETLQSFNRRV
jgi:hypothetical protein